MEIDEDNSLATPVADSSSTSPAVVSDNQSPVSIGNGAIPPVAPISIAPIPRPLAPIPVPVPVLPPPPPSVEYVISEDNRLAKERHEKAKQELLRRRSARLRLGEPITVFGEREMERRDRLRMFMDRGLDGEGTARDIGIDEDDGIQYPFYVEGPKELLEARKDIARYSIAKAALRLDCARRRC